MAYLCAAVSGLVCVIMVLIAGGLALNTASFLSGSATTTGTVVGFSTRESCDRDDHDDERGSVCTTLYAPRVLFTTADGRRVEYTSSTATNPPRYAEGEQVGVRYQPDDPTRARIHAFADLWLAPTIVGGIGVIFGLIGGVLALVGRRLRPKPDGWRDPGTLR